MNDRIIIILAALLILLGTVGYYEKRQAKQLKTNAELVNKNEGCSRYLWNTKQDLRESKEKLFRVTKSCQQLFAKCKEMAGQCDRVIKNKLNCSYSATYLKRDL
jgi:hypothetical protein